MGDPVFVNIDDDAYPVYTAERGTEKMAASLYWKYG